jgi:phosphatidylinositol alpha-mannosyltransferase
VGRLEGRKGVRYLLKAYQQVKREVPNSRLLIVGPGKRMRQIYERQVAWSGLRDVVFIGFASYADLPRYYKTADIFCAPATGRESFGIVLLESMAVSRPIVASNIEGYANVVTHGAEGLLVPPKNEDALARALIYLLKDAGLRRQMGEQGWLKAQNYCWENVSQRVMDYYYKVLSNTARCKVNAVGLGVPG